MDNKFESGNPLSRTDDKLRADGKLLVDHYRPLPLPLPLPRPSNENIPTSSSEKENENVKPVSLNEKFPVEELPPPSIIGPLFSCSEVVRTQGLLRGAQVRIFAEGNEIGSAVSIDGSCSIEVLPLVRGERVTAIQEFDGRASSDSFPEMEVLPHPQKLPVPVFQIPIYECSRFIAFSGCFVGARLYVTVDGIESGMQLIERERQGFYVPRELQVGQKIEAYITLCEKADEETLKAAVAQSATVQQAPDPVPQARIDENFITIGNDSIVVRDILYNARLKLSEARRGAGFVYHSSHQSTNCLLPDGFLVENGDQYSVLQSLCKSSAPSEVVKIDDRDPRFTQLPAPTVQAPICPGDKIVRVSGCRPGAVVVVLVGSRVVTLASANQSEVVIRTPPNLPFEASERVSAVQYIGNIVSPGSAEVTVAGTALVNIEIEGNQHHVNDDGDRYEGVLDTDTTALRIHVKTCCDDVGKNDEPIQALMVNEYGDTFAPITLVSYGSGFYEGIFFPFPDDILPAGRYELYVETPCNKSNGSIQFDVLLTTIDRGDTSPPELSVRVTTQSGRSEMVDTNTSAGVTMDVFLYDPFDIVVEASDRQGLRKVDVQASDGNMDRGLYYFNSGTPPIPIRKTLSRTVNDLNRLQTIRVEAQAYNFNNLSSPVRTPQIIVNVLQHTPILTRLESTRGIAGDTFDIFGNYFRVGSDPTLVRFQKVGSSSIDVVLSSSSFSNTRLSNVDIPRGLGDGNYSVSVVVGADRLESNALSLEVYTPEPEPKPSIKQMLVLEYVTRGAYFARYQATVTFAYGGKILSVSVLDNTAGYLLHTTTGSGSNFNYQETGITAFNGENMLGVWHADLTASGAHGNIPNRLGFIVEVEGV